MAGASLFALLDDIASVLDDVAILTKVAAKKTAGVLGDDLALNAEQVSGVRAKRELPVVWAVAKGSFVNKLILVPAALLLSAVLPWMIVPALMLGGLYLCFEGFEKIWHSFAHKTDRERERALLRDALRHPEIDLAVLEREKIRGAIRTDFILSGEIIVITLGTVATAPFATKATVVGLIAAVMTVGVYGLVAFIVKLDDMALYLVNGASETRAGRLRSRIGLAILAFCPWLMKSLAVVGTIAMFLVGGGIIVHGIPVAQSFLNGLSLPWHGLSVAILQGIAGVAIGAVAVMLVGAIRGLFQRFSAKA